MPCAIPWPGRRNCWSLLSRGAIVRRPFRWRAEARGFAPSPFLPAIRACNPMAKPNIPPDNILSALPPELSSGLFAKGHLQTLEADQSLFLAGDEGDGGYRGGDG